jgi:hypothetical protein
MACVSDKNSIKAAHSRIDKKTFVCNSQKETARLGNLKCTVWQREKKLNEKINTHTVSRDGFNLFYSWCGTRNRGYTHPIAVCHP